MEQTLPDSAIDTTGRTYVIKKKEKEKSTKPKSTLNFCILTPVLKLEMTRHHTIAC